MVRDGKTFAGAQAVLDTPTTAKATSWEAIRARVPRFASRIEALRKVMASRFKEWRRQYCEALRRWVAGEREVVFPAGTWKMHQQFGVVVAEVWEDWEAHFVER